MITGTDSFGPFTDTGVGSTPTPRAYVEEEIHYSGEVDTASSIKPTSVSASHIPHRAKGSPR